MRKPRALLVMLLLVGCTKTVYVTATPSQSGSPSARMATPNSSGSPSSAVTTLPPPPSIEEVVQQLASAVEEHGGYPVKFAVLDRSDLKTDGAQYAPLVVFVWGKTPKSFNAWQVLQEVLSEGHSDAMAQVGIRSYGEGIILKSQDTVWLYVVDVEDAQYVPGPTGQDYIGIALTKTIPDLFAA